jgi:hypothetical protein
MQVSYNVHLGHETRQIDADELTEFAVACGLDGLAPGRYSSLFALQLMLLAYHQGIDPGQVLVEMRALEGQQVASITKQESQFTRFHLKGLWHKHFLPALPSVFAQNILNHLARGGLERLVGEVFGPAQNAIVTSEMIAEMSQRVVGESIQKRAGDSKMTGEWIIYAKEDGKNYYLGIYAHHYGDETIARNLKTVCQREFSFLSKYLD